jgi:PST family polysaccharide transporter
VAIIGAISDLGLTAYGVREMSASSPEQRWGLARDLLGLRLTLTTAGGVAVVLFAWAVYSPLLAEGVALASVGLLFQVTQDNFSLPLIIGLQLGWVAILDLLRQFLTTVCIILFVLLGADLLPFLGVPIPVGIVVLAATALIVRGRRAQSPTFNWQRWRTILAAVLPYSVAVAAGVLYFRVSVLLVSVFCNGTQLGYFGTSYRIIDVLTIVPGLLAGSALPILARAAREDAERFGYALKRVHSVSVMVGAWVAGMIVLGAPLAIQVIAGPRFVATVPVLRLQGIGLGATFVSVTWGYALLSMQRQRVILYVNLFALLFNVALVAPLSLVIGARGAGIGTAAAEIVLATTEVIVVTHLRPEFRPSWLILPQTAIALVLAVVPMIFLPISSIARMFIASFIYGVVLMVARALPHELLDLLPWRRACPTGR